MASNFKSNGTDVDNLLLSRQYTTLGEFYYQSSSSGQLWAWGLGSLWTLGNSNNLHVSSPIQIGSLTNWKITAGGYLAGKAVKSDGTLWAIAGQNSYGDLGLGNTTAYISSPTQVGTMTNWAHVVSGGQTLGTLAVKADGTLWSWGYNFYGNLGLSDTTPRSSPVQIGSLTDWKPAIAMGSDSCLAVKADNTLWVWGNNYHGQLGLGSRTLMSSPVQVGSLTNWKYVSSDRSSFGIKTDGTLWSWGYNYEGQLGLGDKIHRSSPVQVGSLTNWKYVSCGQTGILATKTDGTLWGWGGNGYGQLGLGYIAAVSSPIQIGALKDWKWVVTSIGQFSAGIKTDGTLWTWGNNGNWGMLGLGDRVHRSSPVQVGALTGWKFIQLSNGNMYAVYSNT